MAKPLSRILLIEKDSACGTLLRKGDFEMERADRLSAGLVKLNAQGFDLIVLELSLPDCQGMETFSHVRTAAPQIPIVIVTEAADEKRAAEALQMGAQDYLFKSRLTRLLLKSTIRKAIDRHRGQLAHGYEGFLLQTLMDNIPDAVYFKDTRSRFLMISRAHAKKFGFADPAQVVGKSDADFFSRPHAEQALADEEKIMRSGKPAVGMEESETWPDGSETWVSTTKMPLRDSAGRIVGTFGISRDITKHKRAEEMLRHEQNLLATLMNALPDLIYIKDRQSRFLMNNLAHVRALGANRPEEVVGKTDLDIFPAELAKQYYEDEQALMTSGQTLNREERVVNPRNGEKKWLQTTKLPMRDKNGAVVGLMGISRDITKRKLAELALAERTMQLQKKNRQVEEELKMARELQLAMLPQKFPTVPHDKSPQESALKFFSFFVPSGTVGGDFFDVVPLSSTAVGVFICDVMGHDVRAALVTAMMRSLVRDLSGAATEPGQLLAQINHDLVGVFKQSGATMYATAFYLVVDVATGELSYASAAHPNPLQLRRSHGKVEPLASDAGGKKGPALGLFQEAQFPTYRRKLDAGDVIVLFTDGVIETEGRDQELFSHDRLSATITKHSGLPTKKLLSQVISDLRQFSGQHDFSDDVCLVGVEFKEFESGRLKNDR